MDGIRKLNVAISDVCKKEMQSPYHIGTMISSSSVLINGMEISKDNLLFAEHLTKDIAIKVAIDGKVETGGGGESPHTHPFSYTDTSKYISKLQAGDRVAVIRNGTGKFIILEKLIGV